MSGSVRLSKKHGVNPTIPVCYFCGDTKDEIILLGKLKGDKEAPKNVCWDKEPCTKCKEYMDQGVILISTNDSLTSDPQNPHRSGGWVVVRDEMIRCVLDEKTARDILKARVAFVPDDAWDGLGLPRGGNDG